MQVLFDSSQKEFIDTVFIRVSTRIFSFERIGQCSDNIVNFVIRE